MSYLGGKTLLGSKIAQQVRSRRRNFQPIIEPFCGMASVTQRLFPGPIYASDSCRPLILCLKAVQAGWVPPDFISEEEYYELKAAWKEGVESALIGFVGFNCSWGGKWFAGYARSGDRNLCLECKRDILRKMKQCKDVIFEHKNYKNLTPNNALIYCDPPYAGTTGYGETFDTKMFWRTARRWSKTNTVIISEYVAPPDFKIIAEFDHFSIKSMDKKATTEYLFQLKG